MKYAILNEYYPLYDLKAGTLCRIEPKRKVENGTPLMRVTCFNEDLKDFFLLAVFAPDMLTPIEDSVADILLNNIEYDSL